MDLESAAPKSTSRQKPIEGEPEGTEENREQLDAVGEENKLLREKLKKITDAAPPREASLDVCRGLATTIMIIHKYIAPVVPVMNHVPWDGLNVADVGPPIFLFLAGVSIALAHASQTRNKIAATAHALRRSLWLFGLGVLLEGGFVHGRDSLRFGIDVAEFRVMGTLQRLAVAGLVTTLCEIWAPRSAHWALTVLIPGASAALLYGLRIPAWSFSKSATSSSNANSSNISCAGSDSASSMVKVSCGDQGFFNTEPACNAAAYMDRQVLGLKHMNPVAWYKHLPECRENEGAPDWCFAPFESEGVLTTFAAIATTLTGLHFGHVTVEKKQHLSRLWTWTLPSAILVVLGIALRAAGMVFNRQLWSLSYMCFTAGTAGTLLASVYYLVEAHGCKGGLIPLLQDIGRHSLLLFGLLECDLLRIMLQGFYHRCPENNLFGYLKNHHFDHQILHLLQRAFFFPTRKEKVV